MGTKGAYLTIGETASRCGMSTSALRFYEQKGLITSERAKGNRRRYHRSMIRRIAVVRVAQNLGLSLAEIGEAFDTLPDKRTPNKKDWERLSASWKKRLEKRIADLQNLRDSLTGCIGCGCLSLRRCRLYNPDDIAGEAGAGPRFLLD